MAAELMASHPPAPAAVVNPYRLKPGYVERLEGLEYHLDAPHPDGLVSQPDVYLKAARLAAFTGASSIIDLGCGRAAKLAELHAEHPEWRYLGVDWGPNLEWCQQHYSWGRWRSIDLDRPHAVHARTAVVVCADVLEHLREPRYLLGALRASQARAILISTPERDLTHGYEHSGPPPNPCHVREWAALELLEFLEAQGLTVRRLELTRSDDGAGGRRTLLAHCRGE